MCKKLYTLQELHDYFNKYGMNWLGRVFEIYRVKYKRGGYKYVINDYDYAEEKGIEFQFSFDFTSNSEDLSLMNFFMKKYNREHNDRIEMNNSLIADYIITNIENY